MPLLRHATRSVGLLLAFGTIAISAAEQNEPGAQRVPESASQQGHESVDFSRQVLPILSNKCFVCHGPDTQEATELRLDSFAAATADRGGYHAIDPSDPEKSELLARIASEDDPMPPEDAEKPLTDVERDLLSRWVKQGGKYAKHWAFVPPVKQRDAPNDASAIDWYVDQQLKPKGLARGERADKRTLARRVALVLTGLPPEPELLHDFLADPSDGAYAKLVDKLLASPRLGEHQARYWLDAVRYGDTHGLHLDNRRGIYPYRDWVVRALNQNLPLDDFITWQLAGDLLPDPGLAQQVATGFVRLNPSTGEGGAIPAEFQMKNNFDRVETLGTVFLGLSLTCARCHTHKYDPVTQSEYYRLLAFFNSTAEPAMDGNSYTYGPVVKVPNSQQAWDRWQRLESKRDAMLSGVADASREVVDLVEWARHRSRWRTLNWRISAPYDPDKEEQPTFEKARGLPGVIRGGEAKGKLPGEGKEIRVAFTVKAPADQRFRLTYSGGANSFVLVDGTELPEGQKASDDGSAVVALPLPEGSHEVQVVIRPQEGAETLEVRVDHPWDALAKAGSWKGCDADARLRMVADAGGPWSSVDVSEEASRLSAEIDRAREEFTTSLVARDLAKPRLTQLLHRGEYDQPIGEALTPSVLAVMNPLPADAPPNRLGLAQWLTSPAHPLTARVLVNRIWQRVFGAGLVRTPEDFGLQGEQPTHPELLDWLAVELRESGWNFKQMLRMMVLSETFCQSSAWRDGIDDPENRWLARAGSYRLDAEVLRDIGLWGSGLLDPQMGGEGVKPYQPSGMWKALAHPASNTKSYVQDHGQRLYRRSLYVYWKRTSPHPMMTLFDAPDRESSCVRRSRTNTALQSLGLLNETQRIEMSRKFAERLIRESTNDDARIDRLYSLLACRPADPIERKVCHELLAQLRRRYADAPRDADALLQTGEAPPDEALKSVEVAAWSQVVVTILASDAALLLY